jgi:hypothetical protein
MRLAARVLSFGAIAIAVACASCFIVTGGTDGYTPRDAGGVGDLDASGLTLDCLSATDCIDGGPQICCFALTSKNSGATTCQTGACSGTVAVQLCAADAECGDAACLQQQCSAVGSTFTVRACGPVPLLCTAR